MEYWKSQSGYYNILQLQIVFKESRLEVLEHANDAVLTLNQNRNLHSNKFDLK
jgi:uncharacterized protein with FMN-binding domain